MRDNKPIYIVLLASLVYAVLRYHIFKGVSFEHFPLYVLNKAFSMAGLGMIALAGLGRERDQRKRFGYCGLMLITLHLLISMVILNPVYFGKFFTESGKFTWQAEFSMLAGIAGMLFLFWLLIASLKEPEQPRQQRSLILGVGQAVLVFGGFHVLAMGYSGWFQVETWPGFLPPITLVSFLIVLGTLSLRQLGKTSSATTESARTDLDSQPEQISG